MFRPCVTAALIVLGAATAALGQDAGPAPGRFELHGFPGGGIAFTRSSDGAAPEFKNYTFGGSFVWNVASRAGLEAEAAFGLGGRKTMVFAGQRLVEQAVPDTIAYSVNVVVAPLPSRGPVVPYVTAGVGLLSIVSRTGVETLGILADKRLQCGNIGGGMKWYSARHWGLRGDYRLIATRRDDTAPLFFGQQESRYGHRMYAGIFRTF